MNCCAYPARFPHLCAANFLMSFIFSCLYSFVIILCIQTSTGNASVLPSAKRQMQSATFSPTPGSSISSCSASSYFFFLNFAKYASSTIEFAAWMYFALNPVAHFLIFCKSSIFPGSGKAYFPGMFSFPNSFARQFMFSLIFLMFENMLHWNDTSVSHGSRSINRSPRYCFIAGSSVLSFDRMVIIFL